jgi:hypothetical protein
MVNWKNDTFVCSNCSLDLQVYVRPKYNGDFRNIVKYVGNKPPVDQKATRVLDDQV